MSTPARPKLRTEAWLLLGISSVPGELLLLAGQLSFTAHHTGSAWPWQLRKLERQTGSAGIASAIDAGTRTLVFKWPAQETEAWCPWYYFGGGIKIKKADTVLRISFGEPANMKLRTPRSTPAEALRQASAQLNEVGLMRNRGQLWLAALQPQPPASQGR